MVCRWRKKVGRPGRRGWRCRGGGTGAAADRGEPERAAGQCAVGGGLRAGHAAVSTPLRGGGRAEPGAVWVGATSGVGGGGLDPRGGDGGRGGGEAGLRGPVSFFQGLSGPGGFAPGLVSAAARLAQRGRVNPNLDPAAAATHIAKPVDHLLIASTVRRTRWVRLRVAAITIQFSIRLCPDLSGVARYSAARPPFLG